MITCIVAMDEQAHIGFQGHMPWHIPEELYLFQQLTLHHTILMGRKTWESIGHPLPERKMLIASRTKHEYPYEQVQIVKDVTAILQYYQHSKEELMVCGGREIYQLSLPYAHRIYISIIKGIYPSDTSFPSYDESDFICMERIEYASFTWYYFQRKKDVSCDL